MKLTSGQRTQTHELLAKHKAVVTTLDAAFAGQRITTEGLTAVTKGIGVSAYRRIGVSDACKRSFARNICARISNRQRCC